MGPRAPGRWTLLLALLSGSHAIAQVDPTLERAYQAAQSGHAPEARKLMLRAAQSQPGGAEAHYAEAELLAQEGLVGKAREELSMADRLSPGLPFAPPAAALRLRGALAAAADDRRRPADAAIGPLVTWSGNILWGALLAACGGALAAWLLMLVVRTPRVAVVPPDRQVAEADPGDGDHEIV